MRIRKLFVGIGLGILCFLVNPETISAQQDEYSMDELMGKAIIDLYGDGYQLRLEAHEAFQAMKAAAAADGIDLKVVSSYRSFERQVAIFERKFQRFTERDGMTPLDAIDKIIEYSTIPGTSRHHWGTEIDIIDGNKPEEGDVLVPEKFSGEGPYTDLKEWMDKNSEKFGFYLVYTDEPKRRGFKYEPWHYSYAPLSIPMLTIFRKRNIMKELEKEDFLGASDFTSGLIKNYIRDHVLDINPELL